ncbi:MAG: YbjQ family protein [Halobacteriovoraceae bacterium]|nr:YbjQ family protein [Halobacteriovoraceae bacterium]
MEILIPIGLLILGYTVGTLNEKKHYKSLREREKKLLKLSVEVGTFKEELVDVQGKLVSGHVVIGSDYFKNFASGLRALVGGRIGNYEKLIDRGRREAILRMKKDARKMSASRIVNLRIETARIGNNQTGKNALPCIEVHAYGTAIIEKSPQQKLNDANV